MKNEQPTHLDLFSGIGGFALAAQWAGFRTIGFCEIDKYCQKVLAKNFGVHPNADSSNGSSKSRQQQEKLSAQSYRICSDIFDLDGRDFYGVTLITGGFPCQPFSVAGKRRGAADDRHLWPEMLRVIKEARPTWVLGENVPGIIPMELDNVLSDLESIGYATRPFVIPACAVDARHRRDRLWIICRKLAHTSEQRDSSISNDGNSSEHHQSKRQPRGNSVCEALPNTSEPGLEGQREIACGTGAQLNDAGDYCRWLPEPDVARVAHGVRSRVDRLKGLGNAIVPQVAYEIMREIRKLC